MCECRNLDPRDRQWAAFEVGSIDNMLDATCAQNQQKIAVNTVSLLSRSRAVGFQPNFGQAASGRRPPPWRGRRPKRGDSGTAATPQDSATQTLLRKSLLRAQGLVVDEALEREKSHRSRCCGAHQHVARRGLSGGLPRPGPAKRDAPLPCAARQPAPAMAKITVPVCRDVWRALPAFAELRQKGDKTN